MTHLSRRIFLLLVGGLIVNSTASAGDTYAFYRNAQGHVSEESERQGRLMMQFARRNGQITLWLVLRYPYNVNVEAMTPDEVVEQERQVATGFDDILNPLLERGHAWHPSFGPVIKGPGCTVRATEEGLNSLLADKRIIQITTLD